MAENLPQNPTDALEWIEARAPQWIARAGQIGLSEQLAQEVSDLADLARAKRLAADEAAARAKSATLDWKNTIRSTKARARAAIAAIKAHAAATGDPRVYALAQLNQRDKPGEAPPPNRPTNLCFVVRPRGDVEVSWQGGGSGGPQGTYYIVQRRIDPAGPWVVLGTTTSKRFVDGDLPIGLAEVRYAVVARHNEHEVWGQPLVVRLGTKEAPAPATKGDRAA